MSRIAATVHIDAAARDVWATMMDLEHWPRWASQFASLRQLDGGSLAVGHRVHVAPKGMPASVWRVTEYEDGRSFTWESRLGPGLRVTGGHVLTPSGQGTTAEFWLDAGGAVGTVLGPILRRRVFRRNTRSATDGLKRDLEARGGSNVPVDSVAPRP
jgi:uncharacterized membrane protein